MSIDPDRSPLLHEVATGAQWLGTDEFPSNTAWADEHEAWLRFAKETGGLEHYIQRLRGLRQRRDEAFAELAVGHFLVKRSGMSLVEGEHVGTAGKVGGRVVGSTPVCV